MSALNAEWRKSTRSGTEGNCVEVRVIDGMIEVRDSKNPGGSTLRFTHAEWSAFIGGAEDGEFQLP